jgi:hypothetical protein
MMLDRDVVAISPSSTYRVLKAAGLLQRARERYPDSSAANHHR